MQKQFKDQTAHFLAAIAILTVPLFVIGGYILSAFMIGFMREQGQKWMSDRPNAWKFWNWGKGSWLDISFWTLGGLVVQLVVG